RRPRPLGQPRSIALGWWRSENGPSDRPIRPHRWRARDRPDPHSKSPLDNHAHALRRRQTPRPTWPADPDPAHARVAADPRFAWVIVGTIKIKRIGKVGG